MSADYIKRRFSLDEVAAFLDGSGTLDGISFGEPHPTERGMYWWRKHLRAAVLADRARRTPSPQGDAERLDYLMRRLSGAAIRYYVGELGDTGSLDDFRTAIDTRRNHAGNAQQPASTNTGHGHVFSRPDGVRARCGGPGICAECSRDARSTPAKGGE